MKAMKVWDIREWDGGDRHFHSYYVSNKLAADAWMKRHPHDYIQEMDMMIFDDIKEIDDHISGVTRKRALAKLTKEEKFALGLKDE